MIWRYNINRMKQHFNINTPYGDAGNIEIKEVVKQETIYGPNSESKQDW